MPRMDTTEIKVGDVVRFKSGGPMMTVEAVELAGSNPPSQKLGCVWFEGLNVRYATVDGRAVDVLDATQVIAERRQA